MPHWQSSDSHLKTSHTPAPGLPGTPVLPDQPDYESPVKQVTASPESSAYLPYPRHLPIHIRKPVSIPGTRPPGQLPQ